MTRATRPSLYFAIFALVLATAPGLFFTWAMTVEAMGPFTLAAVAGSLVPIIYLLIMISAAVLLMTALRRDSRASIG